MAEIRIEGSWVKLSDSTISEANEKARAHGMSIGELICDAIRTYKQGEDISREAGEVCPTCKRPGVHCNGC